MTAPLKTIEGSGDIADVMRELGRGARAAARALALAPPAQKNAALAAMAQAVRMQAAAILAANAEDVAEAKADTASTAFLDRLMLDDARVKAMADGIDIVRGLPDPVGKVTESWIRPNGMTIERVRVPLGVVGIVYESRQCRDPARRLRILPLHPRDPCRIGRGAARSRFTCRGNPNRSHA